MRSAKPDAGADADGDGGGDGLGDVGGLPEIQSGKTDSDPANHIRIQSGEQTQIPEIGVQNSDSEFSDLCLTALVSPVCISVGEKQAHIPEPRA